MAKTQGRGCKPRPFFIAELRLQSSDEAPMNVQLPVRLDKPAFPASVERREERYELADGRVVMMTGASRTHGILVLNIAMLLRNQLDPTTVIADFGLDAGRRTLRYP